MRCWRFLYMQSMYSDIQEARNKPGTLFCQSVYVLFSQVFPLCSLTCEDSFYLISGQIINVIVIVYYNCDTISCNLCCCKIFACFFILQFTGSHTDIADSFCCGCDTCCRIALLYFYCDFSAVCFFLSFYQYFHNRCYR